MKKNFVVSRHGKPRLQKFYVPVADGQRKKLAKDIVGTVLSRSSSGKKCQFFDYHGDKVVYRRYASLYFAFGVESTDNELIILETIHRYVEFLDKYFGSVCELDVIFNFEKAHFVLDEFIIGGEVQETSIRTGINAVECADHIMLNEIDKYWGGPESLVTGITDDIL